MRKLYRSDREKWIAGVLGGLGEYLGIDPTILRIAYIIFSIASGGFPGIVGYILAVIIIPKPPLGYQPAAATPETAPSAQASSTAEAEKPSNAPLVVGIILIAIGALFLFNNFIDIRWHLFWPAILIILGLLLFGKALFKPKN